MNLKKILLGSLAVVVAAVSMAPTTNAQLNDAEFDAALAWAYENGLTQYNTVDAFMPFADITREQFAKFAASFVVTNVCLDIDETAPCNFGDLPADPTLDEYVVLACQLGLVRGSGGMFMPTAAISRGEVFTILSRAMSAAAGEAAPSENTTPWWDNHFNAMRMAGVTIETDTNAQARPVLRYEALLMLYRARNADAECADSDITDLLKDLFGDNTTVDPTDDDDDYVAPSSNGTAKAMLSPLTPAGATVPGGVSLKVASFSFTATTEDVVLDQVTLKRTGLGSNQAIRNLTLFVNDQVVTKGRNFNSDFEATFSSWDMPVVVKVGQTLTVDVYGKVGLTAVASNEEFAIQLIDFMTNGSEDKSGLVATANTFRVGGVDGAIVRVLDDGAVSNVSLGEKGVEVAKVQFDNDSNEDVEINQITFKDEMRNADNFENFRLTHKGQVIGTAATSPNRRTVTFTLASPLTITKKQSEDLRVIADVVKGAGDQSNFVIDQETYVQGKGLQFGYGLAVDVTSFNLSSQTFTILAGDITLSENPLPARKARQNQRDVVLADFGVILNAGKDITLENIQFDLNTLVGNDLGGTATFNNVFEDVELEVWINGSRKTFDLNVVGTPSQTSISYADTQMAIAIPANATVQVRLVADTLTTLSADVLNRRFNVTMSTCSVVSGTCPSPNFRMIENQDDRVVTDITPSVLTFNTVELVDSSFAVTRLNRGNVSVVRGSKDIDAIAFQIKADDVSDLFVQDITVNGVSNFASSHVSQVKLWNWVNDQWTLVSAEGGTKIAGGNLIFDRFPEIKIALGETMQFLVTVDVVNDVNNVTDVISVRIPVNGVRANDDNNRSLTSQPAVATAIGRTITIANSGELTNSVDNNNTDTSRAQNVLAGTTSNYLATFRLVATNEPIRVEDFQINVAGAANFANAVTELVVFSSDGTEVARESVIADTVVEFDNVNLLVPQGTNTYYVRAVTNGIGFNFDGEETVDATLAFQATTARGEQSGQDVTLPGATAVSLPFRVIPVHISGIALTPAAGAATNGWNDLGTIEITANSWTNTDTTDGSELDIILNQLQFTIETAGLTLNDVRVERLDGGNVNPVCNVGAALPPTNPITVNFASCGTNVPVIKASQVARYKVEANLTTTAGGQSVQLRLNNLDLGAIVYQSSQLVGTPVSALRLQNTNTSIVGTQKVSVAN